VGNNVKCVQVKLHRKNVFLNEKNGALNRRPIRKKQRYLENGY
jgi:hypothetical protein